MRRADAHDSPDRSPSTDSLATDASPALDAEPTDDPETAPDLSDGSADGRAGGRGRRVRDTLLKPPPAGRPARKLDPAQTMTPVELAYAIKRVDDRERAVALFTGIMGIVFGIFITVFAIHINPAVGHKNHASPTTIAYEGGARVLLALLVLGAAFTRRRSFIGFTLLFLGTAMGNPLFAMPFWIVGGWMIWRVFKWQKVLTAKGGDPERRAAGGATRSDRGNGRVAPTRSSAPRAGGRRGRPAPAGPTPSKRYTPPKPSRPKPPVG